VEPEETAAARERPINTFPRQQTRGATREELLETVFSVGSGLARKSTFGAMC
jgi:hypothetical protein